MRQVISLWLPRLATDRLRRRRGRLSGSARESDRTARSLEPLVTIQAAAGRLILDAVDPAAAGLGLRPGMPLADARAIEPNLVVIDADPAADRRALEDLADWCGRYTPWVATEAELVHGAGGIWLDVTGCAHLFGGEAGLIGDLMARVAGFGYAVRAAHAETPGAAWALARFDDRSAAGLVLEPAVVQAALVDLPVAGLRLPPSLVSDLERFGLGRIGSLHGIARGPLVARFGDLLARRLDQMRGRVSEPLSPRRPVPAQRARRAFPEPITTRDALVIAVRGLLAELCAGLERHGSGARRLELAIYRLDGAVRRLPVGTHRAVRAPDYLMRLIADHLDKLDYTVGVEVATLAATATERMVAQQLTLARPLQAGRNPAPRAAGGRGPERSESPDAADLAPLLDRLSNRLGRASVRRPALQASHIPERAQRLLPLLDGPVTAAPGRARAARPPRLLARPEPIEAMALVPDDPPRQFRWRGRTHQVRRAEGPERIAAEWWRGDAATRDYYRIEDDDGHRFWVYRDGLYGTASTAPRWYLHGLFA